MKMNHDSAIVAQEQLIEIEERDYFLRDKVFSETSKLHSSGKYNEDPYRVDLDVD